MASRDKPRWVRCVNCGEQYYFEGYIYKSKYSCPVCNSKEKEEVMDEDDTLWRKLLDYRHVES